MTEIVSKYLRRDDAANYVRKRWGVPCSRGLLAKLAVLGEGPVMHYTGRFPLYSEGDLDAWATNRIGKPQRSTAGNSQPHGT